MKRRDLILGAVASGATGVIGSAYAAQNVKCVIVGDAMVGKTWALSSFARNTLPASYVPTVVSDPLSIDVTLLGQPLHVSLWDTSGDEGYARLRPVAYAQTDVFIVAYAVDSMTSIDNVQSRWAPEIRAYYSGARIVLAGLKADLRAGRSSSTVSKEAAKSIAAHLALQAYGECSARTQVGLDDLFANALGIATNNATVPPGSLQRSPMGRQPIRRPGN